MPLNEQRYYFTLVLYEPFAAVSVQKAVRDRMEGMQLTGIYHGLASCSAQSALLLFIGLWNAALPCSPRGCPGMAYAPVLFAAIAVQKNTRDAPQAGGATSMRAAFRRPRAAIASSGVALMRIPRLTVAGLRNLREDAGAEALRLRHEAQEKASP